MLSSNAHRPQTGGLGFVECVSSAAVQYGEPERMLLELPAETPIGEWVRSLCRLRIPAVSSTFIRVQQSGLSEVNPCFVAMLL